MKPYFEGGAWRSSGQPKAVTNPWTGETIAEVCVADRGAVEDALASAAKAFEVTSKIPAHERAKTLTVIAESLLARKSEFVELLVAEAGKPVVFSEAEVDRAASTFRFAAALALSDEGHAIRMDASPQGAGHFGLVKRFPLGVILGITPFNFPLNLVAHKVAPCLASGNTMILKPALKTPLTALLLAEVLESAGLPAGQINTMPFGHDAVDFLLADDRIKMLSFTGGVDVGWNLKARAKKQKVALELGGNAAVIVEPDTDLAAAIPKIAAGAFGYAGQSCISVQRIFVHRSILERFSKEFASHVIAKCHAGDPRDRQTVLGPMIDAGARAKIVQWVRDAEHAGARLLTPLREEGRSLLHPVVIASAPRSAAVACEEAFAPLVVIDGYDDFSEALAQVNDSAFGLQAGVFTRDISRALHAFETLEVGGVLINQVPTFRVENMPYGGLKDSGFGREGLRYAIEEMTEPRSLIVNLA
ncbi:MAG: aldehyde dehydrogenase family protein [Terrimicrobiaceae bacterium]